MFAVISETLGLVELVASEAHAENLAFTYAVDTGRTTYVKPASEVTV